jgi:hypothetical protein
MGLAAAIACTLGFGLGLLVCLGLSLAWIVTAFQPAVNRLSHRLVGGAWLALAVLGVFIIAGMPRRIEPLMGPPFIRYPDPAVWLVPAGAAALGGLIIVIGTIRRRRQRLALSPAPADK